MHWQLGIHKSDLGLSFPTSFYSSVIQPPNMIIYIKHSHNHIKIKENMYETFYSCLVTVSKVERGRRIFVTVYIPTNNHMVSNVLPKQITHFTHLIIIILSSYLIWISSIYFIYLNFIIIFLILFVFLPIFFYSFWNSNYISVRLYNVHQLT